MIIKNQLDQLQTEKKYKFGLVSMPLK